MDKYTVSSELIEFLKPHSKRLNNLDEANSWIVFSSISLLVLTIVWASSNEETAMVFKISYILFLIILPVSILVRQSVKEKISNNDIIEAYENTFPKNSNKRSISDSLVANLTEKNCGKILRDHYNIDYKYSRIFTKKIESEITLDDTKDCDTSKIESSNNNERLIDSNRTTQYKQRNRLESVQISFPKKPQIDLKGNEILSQWEYRSGKGIQLMNYNIGMISGDGDDIKLMGYKRNASLTKSLLSHTLVGPMVKPDQRLVTIPYSNVTRVVIVQCGSSSFGGNLDIYLFHGGESGTEIVIENFHSADADSADDALLEFFKSQFSSKVEKRKQKEY